MFVGRIGIGAQAQFGGVIAANVEDVIATLRRCEPAGEFVAVVVATGIAALLGPLLGRLATQWFSGMGFSNRLTEVRGAFLPFILCPLLGETTDLSAWLVIGIVVGFMQAVAAAVRPNVPSIMSVA